MKKISILSVLLLMLILPHTMASAVEEMSGYCGDNLTWTLKGETLTISGTGDMWDYGMDSGTRPFWYDRTVKEVILEDGITRIGSCTFYMKYGLEHIIIPDTVTSIGESAFEQSMLEDIYIPDTVTSIGNCCFRDCYALAAVRLPSDITIIPYEAFDSCVSLAYIEIPENVTSIGQEAFRYSGLRAVTIPGNVKKVWKSAFSETGNLEFIEFEDGIEEIEAQSFTNDNITMFVGEVGSICASTWTDTKKVNVFFAGDEKEWDSINKVTTEYGNKALILTYNADLSNSPSDWAADYIENAKQFGMTVDKRYSQNIMRYEFCSLIHSLISSKNADLIKDTENPTRIDNLDDMYDLIGMGIILGDGNGNYTPYYPITREEAAVIIKRVIDLMQVSFSENISYNLADSDNISDWAAEAVDYMFSHKLLEGEDGESGTAFNPKNSYTREQAIVTLMRIIEKGMQ